MSAQQVLQSEDWRLAIMDGPEGMRARRRLLATAVNDATHLIVDAERRRIAGLIDDATEWNDVIRLAACLEAGEDGENDF